MSLAAVIESRPSLCGKAEYGSLTIEISANIASHFWPTGKRHLAADEVVRDLIHPVLQGRQETIKASESALAVTLNTESRPEANVECLLLSGSKAWINCVCIRVQVVRRLTQKAGVGGPGLLRLRVFSAENQLLELVLRLLPLKNDIPSPSSDLSAVNILSIAPLPLRSIASHASSDPAEVQDRRSAIPSGFRSKLTPSVASVKSNPLPNTSITMGVPEHSPDDIHTQQHSSKLQVTPRSLSQT
jgi:hypothetical protein